MKLSKMAEMTEDELRRELSTLEEKVFRLRFQIGTGNIENPSRLGETRKDLARVKTLIRERELRLKISHESVGSNPEKPAGTAKAAGKSSEAR